MVTADSGDMINVLGANRGKSRWRRARALTLESVLQRPKKEKFPKAELSTIGRGQHTGETLTRLASLSV